mmetsp:Transcript_25333/g.31221  ORF Transcript_25333/g.31221 Transcript_25333/m.31221 type:complete len:87 (-) Transcript_25333:114-374(-)
MDLLFRRLILLLMMDVMPLIVLREMRKSNNPVITIDADCGVRSNGKEGYCTGTPTEYQPSVYQEGFEQVSYDKCCDINDLSSCEYA